MTDFKLNKIKAGKKIKSTDELIGSFFENSTILIIKHNDEGSVGFITNKPFGKSLHDLIEFNHSKQFQLMDGGPVDRDHLFVLHKRPDLIDEGEALYNGYFLGGNMEQVIAAINSNSIDQAEMQIFIGYCGWDNGELETEIEEGSWKIE